MRYLNYNDGTLTVSLLRHPDSRLADLDDIVRAVHTQSRDRLAVAVWDDGPAVADTLTRDDYIANAELPLAAANAVREYAEEVEL